MLEGGDTLPLPQPGSVLPQQPWALLCVCLRRALQEQPQLVKTRSCSQTRSHWTWSVTHSAAVCS